MEVRSSHWIVLLLLSAVLIPSIGAGDGDGEPPPDTNNPPPDPGNPPPDPGNTPPDPGNPPPDPGNPPPDPGNPPPDPGNPPPDPGNTPPDPNNTPANNNGPSVETEAPGAQGPSPAEPGVTGGEATEESPPEETDGGEPSEATEEPEEKEKHNAYEKCKPNEILTTNKGCVDRDELINRVLLHAWVDENMDEAKKEAGLVDTDKCNEGEILTAYGCATKPDPPRARESQRSPVFHSRLSGQRVLKGDGFETGDTEDSQEDLHKPTKKHKRKGSSRGSHKSVPGPHVIGHNRPRTYVFLPGRRLHSQRRCRPYEVLGRNQRCIRKRGKQGVYQHKDHKYGLQKRHRHENYLNRKPADPLLQ